MCLCKAVCPHNTSNTSAYTLKHAHRRLSVHLNLENSYFGTGCISTLKQNAERRHTWDGYPLTSPLCVCYKAWYWMSKSSNYISSVSLQLRVRSSCSETWPLLSKTHKHTHISLFYTAHSRRVYHSGVQMPWLCLVS